MTFQKSHLIAFSVLSPWRTQSKLQTPFLTVPSPLLHASDHLVVAQALQRSSSPSTTQPSSLTKITICIHLTICSSSSLIQDTQLCSQEKSGNNIDDYSLAEASTAQQLTLATFPHMSTCLRHQLTHFYAVGPRLWRAGMDFNTGSHYNPSA